MLSARTRRLVRPLAAAAALVIVAAGCSVGSIGGDSNSGSSAGTTEISFLFQNDSATQALGKALIDGFEAENPNIKVTSETQPGGTEGDNLTKTKLSTGEMSDVFLLQLGIALPGPEPGHESGAADRPAVGQPAVGGDEACRQHRQRHLWCAARYDVRRRRALQQEGLREARTEGPTSWAEFEPTTRRSRPTAR